MLRTTDHGLRTLKTRAPGPRAKRDRALGCFEWISALSGLVAVATAAATTAVATAAATTTAATAAVAAAAATTATTAATLLAWPGLVHGQGPALEHGAVQRGNRRVRP